MNKGQIAIPFMLVLLLLVLALLLLPTLFASSKTGGAIRNIVHGSWDLPFSKHALEGHASEQWNATTIVEYFNQGKCTPTEYLCTEQDFRVLYCVVNDEKSIGLIIGLTVQKIVTGFLADTGYWQSRCP